MLENTRKHTNIQEQPPTEANKHTTNVATSTPQTRGRPISSKNDPTAGRRRRTVHLVLRYLDDGPQRSEQLPCQRAVLGKDATTRAKRGCRFTDLARRVGHDADDANGPTAVLQCLSHTTRHDWGGVTHTMSHDVGKTPLTPRSHTSSICADDTPAAIDSTSLEESISGEISRSTDGTTLG